MIKICTNNLNDEVLVYYKDAPLKFKKENGDFVAEVDYSPEIELTFVYMHEFRSKLWFLYMLFFYIISVFGLFAKLYEKSCIQLNTKVVLKPNSSNEVYNFRIHKPKNPSNEIAVLFSNDDHSKNIFYDGDTNFFVEDPVAKKRKKLYNLFAALSWIAIIISVVAIVIVSLI